MKDRARQPVIPHFAYRVRPDVEIALDAVINWLCATGSIDGIWANQPCDQSKAIAVHETCIHELGKMFVDKGEVNLSVYADDDYCGLTLQVNAVKGKNEPAAFRGIPMAARRNLAREGALNFD